MPKEGEQIEEFIDRTEFEPTETFYRFLLNSNLTDIKRRICTYKGWNIDEFSEHILQHRANVLYKPADLNRIQEEHQSLAKLILRPETGDTIDEAYVKYTRTLSPDELRIEAKRHKIAKLLLLNPYLEDDKGMMIDLHVLGIDTFGQRVVYLKPEELTPSPEQ